MTNLLSITKVCEILSIGRNKCYQLIFNQEIEAIKIGNATRIKQSSVEGYIERATIVNPTLKIGQSL